SWQGSFGSRVHRPQDRPRPRLFRTQRNLTMGSHQANRILPALPTRSPPRRRNGNTGARPSRHLGPVVCFLNYFQNLPDFTAPGPQSRPVRDPEHRAIPSVFMNKSSDSDPSKGGRISTTGADVIGPVFPCWRSILGGGRLTCI